jgi:hypothetical protein
MHVWQIPEPFALIILIEVGEDSEGCESRVGPHDLKVEQTQHQSVTGMMHEATGPCAMALVMRLFLQTR